MRVINKFPLLAFLLCLIHQCSGDVEISSHKEEHDTRYLLRHSTHRHDHEFNNNVNKENKANNDRFQLEQGEEEEEAYFRKLKNRMKPHFLQINPDDSSTFNLNSLQTSGPPYQPPVKQFYHLHHMKTGGTSLEGYISCALRRHVYFYNLIQTDRLVDSDAETAGTTTKQHGHYDRHSKLYFPQYKLSECSNHSYLKCVTGPSNSTCYERISNASLMTYCAPLAITRHFGWNDDSFQTPSVTMLRNPVERVWSMYRFQTRGCYKCKSLKEVYEDIDNGNTTEYGGICIPQITNHITRNLLTNLTVDELNGYTSQMSDEEKVRDAIHSVKYRFTVVGIIERLEESLELLSHSFPWLREKFDTEYYNDFSEYYDKYEDKLRECPFPHSNSSPRNNGCGEGHTHMDLPEHPDEETRKIIEEHNKMDIEIYEAALEHFEWQKRAMEWEDEEDLER